MKSKLSILVISIIIIQSALYAQTQIGQDIEGNASDLSGLSVSINNDGSIEPINEILFNGTTGRVRIYQYNGISWIQRGQDIEGEAAGDKAQSVFITGNGSIVAVGSPFNDGNGTNSGHVRVHNLSGILSIDAISNELNITLYPNPPNDYVDINGANAELSPRVYDVLGREVLSKKVTNSIDVKLLKWGSYFGILLVEHKKLTRSWINY